MRLDSYPNSSVDKDMLDDSVQLLRQNFPDLLAVYVFGSVATQTASAESDLDLAIMLPGKIEPLVLWDCSAKVAELVGCDVDLLDFKSASTVMQYQVITTGYRLWESSSEAAIYESFVLSEKTALDEARKPLLEHIAKDGHIYAR